jgi:hypothetical protein
MCETIYRQLDTLLADLKNAPGIEDETVFIGNEQLMHWNLTDGVAFATYVRQTVAAARAELDALRQAQDVR